MSFTESLNVLANDIIKKIPKTIQIGLVFLLIIKKPVISSWLSSELHPV
jgi:hypothetical protein